MSRLKLVPEYRLRAIRNAEKVEKDYYMPNNSRPSEQDRERYAEVTGHPYPEIATPEPYKTDDDSDSSDDDCAPSQRS